MPDYGSTDRVRRSAAEAFIKPARQRGDKFVTIHSGTLERMLVERKLLQPNRFPVVCNALRSRKFSQENGLRLQEIQSPAASGQSSTVSFVFSLEPEAPTSPRGLHEPSFNDLRGLLKQTYRKLGGAAAFHAEERESWNR
jgi:hypothetical protein